MGDLAPHNCSRAQCHKPASPSPLQSETLALQARCKMAQMARRMG
eukprot:CAMPEP_0181242176 /NCGR_PEP_ID=MMETSP1096-20121128/41539_1 /TAXON_ID=156174 ORGANISM="Chrysochromulina ericina, Strain CCMP281" /NCGR_SAMPLE_ID=MMETSP1096 /ASSEMBLY_ACC=CAM_ASM_000453 /LENGTH=44 /DNA_ID= /DNA_START= /DNA_END= /DNA_ORIENTATION=